MAKLNDLYSEMISKEGLKNVLNDFLTVKDIKKDDLSLDEESKLKKLWATFDSLANSIILLDKYEKGEENSNMVRYIIRAVHQSMVCDIFNLVGISMWFFYRYTKVPAVETSQIIDYFNKRQKLSEAEKRVLLFPVFSDFKLMLNSFLIHQNTFRTYGGVKETIRFQVTDTNLDPLLLLNSSLMNDQDLIESKPYFSSILLSLLEYLELMFKYICIDYYKIDDLDKLIEDFYSENKNSQPFDPIPIFNMKRLIKIYDEFLD